MTTICLICGKPAGHTGLCQECEDGLCRFEQEDHPVSTAQYDEPTSMYLDAADSAGYPTIYI